MIKLTLAIVLGIIAGTAFGHAVKAQPTSGCVTNTIMYEGRMITCTVCYYPGGSTTNCI